MALTIRDRNTGRTYTASGIDEEKKKENGTGRTVIVPRTDGVWGNDPLKNLANEMNGVSTTPREDPFANITSYADAQAAIARNYQYQTEDLANSRAGKTITGGIETGNAGYLGTAATLNDYFNQYYAAPTVFNDDGTIDWKSSVEAHKPSEIVQDAVNNLHAKEDAMRGRGEQRITEAKDGLGWVGQRLVDAGVSGIQMLGDAAINTLLPGAGLAAMGTRAFGNAAADARKRGANVAIQAGYGAAVAGVEILSEKLFDGLAGIYGKGTADKLVEDTIKKLTKSAGGQKVLKWLASGIGEAGEEIFSGLIDPALESIIDKQSIFSHYDADTWSDLLESAVVGGVLGLLGGSVEASPIGQNAETQNTIAEYQELTQQAKAAQDYYYQTVQQYGPFSEQAKNVRDTVITPVQTRLNELRSAVDTSVPTVTEYDQAKNRNSGMFFSNMGEPGVQAIIDTGMESDPGTESRKLAEEYSKRIKSGGTLTEEEIGRLYRANTDAIREEAWRANQSVREYSSGTQVEAEPDRLQQLAQDMASEQVKAMQPIPAFPNRQAATARPAQQVQTTQQQAAQPTQNAAQAGGRTEAEKTAALRRGYEQAKRIVAMQSPERQNFLQQEYEKAKQVLNNLQVGDTLVDDNGQELGKVVAKSEDGITISGEFVTERIPAGTFADDSKVVNGAFGDDPLWHFEHNGVSVSQESNAPAAAEANKFAIDVVQNGATYEVHATNDATGKVDVVGRYATQADAQEIADSLRTEVAEREQKAYNGNGTKEVVTSGGQGNNAVRPGNRGNQSQSAGQQTGSVSERTEGTPGQRGTGSQNAGNEQESRTVAQRKQVEAEDLIPGAKSGQKISVLDGPETKDHREAVALAKQNGIDNVTLFEGPEEGVQHDRIGIVRAYHKASGEIGVQSNNREFSAADFTRHEIMEHKLDTGELTADQVIEAAEQYVDRGLIDQAIDFYYNSLLPDGETTAEQREAIRANAKDELVCDGGDHINQLRYDVEHGMEAYRDMADLLDTVLDGLNKAANELTDNAFTLKEDTETRYSGKLKGEDNNGRKAYGSGVPESDTAALRGGNERAGNEAESKGSIPGVSFLSFSRKGQGAIRREVLKTLNADRGAAHAYSRAFGTDEFIGRIFDFYAKGGNMTALNNLFPGITDAIVNGTLEAIGMQEEDGAARWTPERIAALYSDKNFGPGENAKPGYAKSYAVIMSPDDFLSLSATAEERTNIEIDTATKPAWGYGEASEAGLRKADTPRLYVNMDTGRVADHEGRHRMSLLLNAGIDSVPVLIAPYSQKGINNATPIRSMTLKGQTWKYGTAPGTVKVTDIVPLSESYRSEIEQRFGGDAQIRFSSKLSPQEETQNAINQSMTMERARDMIQRAFVLGEIKEWYDGKYKNGDEWLRGEGAADVAMIVDNEYSLQAAYLDKIQGILDGDFYAEDIIEAYQNGTLTGKAKAPQAKADLSSSTAVNDPRFYAPKQIENAKSLYETATQRVTKTNEKDVIAARAAILLYAHNKGAAETLEITEAELNKKLRSWSNYSASARQTSQRINSGVHESNRWTGIENSSYVMRATVSQDDVARMVGSVEGDSDAYQNKYIARTILALDTHIDWSWLNFKFDTPAGVNSTHSANTPSGKCAGYYLDSSRLIHVKRDAPNTVAHEMGHALDYQWGREVGVGGALTQSSRNSARISDEVRPWFDRFHEFCDTLVDSSDIRSSYSGDIKETFARFVDRFVGWTEQLATGREMADRGWYNDKFTASQYVQFARLLQEKAALDANGATRNQVPNAQETRFSQKITTDKELQKQNDELRQRVEYWRGQTRRTTTPTARQADVDAAARDIVRYYAATVSAKDIAPQIKDLTEYIMRGGEDLRYSEVKSKAYDIARTVIQSAEALREGDGGTYDEVRSLLKRPMVISMQDAHDVSPEWGTWRNANVGKVNVSINGKGTPVDTIYAELSEKYPSLFPESITHPADQVQRMVEVLDDLAPVYENPYSYYMADAIEGCANDIIDRVLSEDIRQTPPTFADRADARLAAEKARGAQKVAQVREQKNEQIDRLKAKNAERAAAAIAKERAARDAKIKALKDHYADIKLAASERKADSAARTKLLKMAKRLKNMKLPAANRALLNQYIGDIDTISKGITGKSIENLTELRDWYEGKTDPNSQNYDPDFLRDTATEERIKRLSKKHISELTQQELADLTEVLQNLENEFRTQKRMIDAEDRRDTYQQGVDTIEDVKATKGSKGGPLDKFIVTETLSPVRQMHRITGYNENDPLYLRTQELADGQRKMFDYQMRANQRFKKFLEDKKFIKSLAGKKAQWIEISGYNSEGKPVKVMITPAMRMSLYLHSLNDQNLKHIRDGGITIPDQKLYQQGKIAEAYARGETIKLTPSAVRSIAAGMTAQERAFANAAHDYFNGMSRDEINAVSEKLKGYSIAGVEDYFPINTDTAFTKSDFESLKFDGTLEGMGFLKERVNARNPIMLRDMNDVLTQSINQHAKYVGLAIPVRNFNKVWGVTQASFNEDGSRNSFESSVQKAISQKWGKDAVDYVEKMMGDLQNSGGTVNKWKTVLGKVRSNYAQAVLTLNLSVAMKQAASYPNAAAVIGWRPLARAMADVGRVDLDKIAQYTPLQWYRSQGYSSQELGDMAKRGVKLPPALNWVQGIDLLTTRKLWKASEYYVRQNNKDLKIGSDEYYKEVANIYNQVIEETQPNYTTMQRPQILRTDDTLMSNIIMFKTQPMQNFNVLYDAFGNLQAKRAAYMNASETNKAEAKAAYETAQKRAAWAAESQFVSLAVFAAMTYAWAALRGKDDKYRDKEGNLTLKSVLGGLGKNMLSGAMGMAPIGTEVYDLLASKIFGDKYYGIDAVTPSALSDFATAVYNSSGVLYNTVQSVLKGEPVDWNSVRLKMGTSIDAMSKLFGIPIENVKNLFNMIYRQTAIRAAGQYAGTYSYLRLTADPSSKSAQYYDNLYEASKNDPEQYNMILQDMIDSGDFDEDKIKNAMESRMKKEQGVGSVNDLDQRWMLPEQQTQYDSMIGAVERTKAYGSASEDQIDALEDAIYDYVIGNDSGRKTADKISGGAKYGLDADEYFEYMLALKVADANNEDPSKRNKSIDQSEARDALDMITGLSDEEKSYLWQTTNSSWKENKNPFGAPAATPGEEPAEEPAQTEESGRKIKLTNTAEAEKEKPKKETADVSGSTAISSAVYDPETETATVKWASNGRTYTYDVSPESWEGFKNSSSKGSYVNRNWK